MKIETLDNKDEVITRLAMRLRHAKRKGRKVFSITKNTNPSITYEDVEKVIALSGVNVASVSRYEQSIKIKL